MTIYELKQMKMFEEKEIESDNNMITAVRRVPNGIVYTTAIAYRDLTKASTCISCVFIPINFYDN